MLDDPRRHLVELVAHVLPPLVLAGDRDRGAPLDGHEHPLEREAALVGDVRLLAPLDDLGIDDRHVAALLDRADEEPLQDADLRRGQPNADCVVHERLHPLHQGAELVVEPFDRTRAQPQRGVRVLPDLCESKPAPGSALGVQLLVDDLPFYLRHASADYRRMDPRQLNEIMSQGAVKPETPRDRRERETVEEDLLESPVRGKPLRRRIRNFRPDPDAGIRALGGPTAWMRRLRAIEDATAEHERQLGEAWRELALEVDDEAEFALRWRAVAERWSFGEVNELIEGHNRNFPAEARLPMDPKTRDFVRVNGKPYRREPLDADWILERFPPERPLAA